MGKTYFDTLKEITQIHDRMEEKAQNAAMLEIERNKLEETRALSERLEAINTSLQEQLTAAKAEAEAARKDAKRASIRSWISVGVAVACAIVEVVSLILHYA